MPNISELANALTTTQIQRLVEPAFVLDHVACELVWANPDGLSLFDVDSVEALRTVSLPDRLLRTPAARLQAKCQSLRPDSSDRINLVLFDAQGEPGELWRCEIRSLLDDGSMTLFRVIPRGTDLLHDFMRDTPHGQLLSALLGDGPVETGLKDRDGRYLLVSEYAAGLLGMTAADLEGQLTQTVLPPDVAATIAAADRHVVDTGQVVYTEVLTDPDYGDRVYWALKFPVFGDDGAVTGSASLATDITRVKNMQVTLESQQASLLEANTKLVGGIAHEFNNLLTVILGYTSLAQGAAGARRRMYLSQVQQAGMDARSLVDKLLTYTQTRSHTPDTIDVVPFVQQSLQRLQPELGIAVTLEKLPASPVKTRIDPTHLAQLLRELLANAARASRDGANVRMRIHVLRDSTPVCSACHQIVKGEMLAVEFQDNGPGIEPADINRVFQPFYTTNPPGEGRGLGLSVVHGISHQNGGHMTLGTTPGGGCTAIVYLPVFTGGAGLSESPRAP